MAALPVWAKTDKQPKVDKETAEGLALLEAAAPHYDFSSPEMKPWHLKATYQLYDDAGKPTEQGTYEYWWASPKVHRSTWARKGASRTEWHTVGGVFETQESGEPLKYFERDLPRLLLSPLPNEGETDSKDVKLAHREVKIGKVKVPCVMLVQTKMESEASGPPPIGKYATYCFDTDAHALRFAYRYGQLTIEFLHVVKIQSRYLPFSIQIIDGQKQMFSVTVTQVSGLNPEDSALLPAKDAKVSEPTVFQSDIVLRNELVKRVMPAYPSEARADRKQGTVALAAIIGTDGRIEHLELIVSPWPILTKAAEDGIEQWRYKPYLVDGKPVKVETTINVVFSLGG